MLIIAIHGMALQKKCKRNNLFLPKDKKNVRHSHAQRFHQRKNRQLTELLLPQKSHLQAPTTSSCARVASTIISLSARRSTSRGETTKEAPYLTFQVELRPKSGRISTSPGQFLNYNTHRQHVSEPLWYVQS